MSSLVLFRLLKVSAMFIRLAFATLLTVVGVTTAFAQVAHPEPRKTVPRKVVPAQATVDAPPEEQKWVEESIDKFLNIPNDIFNPQPPRR